MTPASTAPTLAGARALSRAFADAINRGDLHGAADTFTRDACLLTPDSTAIQGREEIRAILSQLIARGARIEVLSSTLLLAGKVALGSERWRIRTTTTGSSHEQSSQPTLVARHLEGAWKLAIVTPWGWGPTGVGAGR